MKIVSRGRASSASASAAGSATASSMLRSAILQHTLFEKLRFFSDSTLCNFEFSKKVTSLKIRRNLNFPAFFQLCLQTKFQLSTRSKNARNSKYKLNIAYLAWLVLFFSKNEIGGKSEGILQCGAKALSSRRLS